MSKVNELSPKDKKLLESFDISIFKSAVAYIQSNRYNSCQPTWSSEGKSPGQGKMFIKDREPPLLPMESRIAILSKKYGNDSFAVKNKSKVENRGKIVDIFHYKTKSSSDIEVKPAESNLNIEETNIQLTRKKHPRRTSQVFKDNR